jgi:hypothetical protein
VLDGCVCILSYSPASHRGYIGPGSTFFRWALDLPRRPPQFTTHNHPPGHVTVLNKYIPWPLSITPFPSIIALGTNCALLKATPGLWCMIIYRRRRLCYLGISQPHKHRPANHNRRDGSDIGSSPPPPPPSEPRPPLPLHCSPPPSKAVVPPSPVSFALLQRAFSLKPFADFTGDGRRE